MVQKWVVRLSVATLLGVSVLVPVTASAQQASGIAGLVRDTSGGVLPGVTVEAASPALIEKVRSVVTDGEGRYSIVDLRPGTYAVTFTLTGFNTLRRDGITLTAGFTAAVNADMQVGSVEETITVTGAAPLVDTQNVKQQKVVSADLLTALPSGSHGLMLVARLIPGMSMGTDPGGSGAAGINGANRTTSATLHGKVGGVKNFYDGMPTMNLGGTGSVTYIMNPATVEETTIETGGVSAETDASGLSFNMVPKEGGNVFKFGADVTYTNQHLQGENLSDTLRARGVTTSAKTLYAYDTNVTVGGPVKRDKLWFFAATRFTGTRNRNPGKYFNKTQGTVFFTPDLDRPAYYQDWLRSQAVRLTWQASPRNKLNGFADPQYLMIRGQGDNAAPEAHTCWFMWPVGLYQIAWTSPVTSKFLLEAGASLAKGPYPCTRENVTDIFGFAVKPTDVSVLETSTGFRYNAEGVYNPRQDQNRYAQRFSASYVTGSHNFKVGLQLQQHLNDVETVVNSDGRNASCSGCPVTYTFNRGVPTQITQWATPYLQKPRTKAELGLFAQDRWAIHRLTLNYGLRFDYFNGYMPAQHVDAGQFVGARDFAAVHDVPNWKDLNPRLGASYDLFGDSRTALKTSLGRYVGKMGINVALANDPIQTSVNSVNRTWNDANGNYIPDCDLHNFAVNGECGAIDNINFGQVNPSATQYADDLIRGFGTRDYLWDLSAEMEHQFSPRVSMTGGYYRNWSAQFASGVGVWNTGVADNLAVTPAEYSPYCITAPVDSRLPGGGGYPVCGLYDVSRAKFGQGQSRLERASHYSNVNGGNGKSRYSDFFTVSANTRFGRGIEFGASLDTGRTVDDECFVVDSPQALLNCRVVTPFKGQTQIKVHGVYPLPGGVIVSGIFQNLSGVEYEANYAAPNAAIAPSLGRNLASCGTRVVCTATATAPLITPQTQFEPRQTLLDLRLTKVFLIGPRTRLRANVDVYNVLNDSAILAINNNYGLFWRQGQGKAGGLVASRLFQFSGQLTF